MSNVKLARALRAAASVLEEDESAAVAANPSLADRIVAFLENDTSGYHARSAEAIAKALEVGAGNVSIAANDPRLISRQSRGSLGTLISLAD